MLTVTARETSLDCKRSGRCDPTAGEKGGLPMTFAKRSWPAVLAAAACLGWSHAPAVQSQSALFEGAQVPVGPGSGQVLLVDVNGDRHLDLVTRHLLQRRIDVFIGDGKGGFTPGAASSIDLAYQPGNIAIDDVNGDGTADLIAVQ